MSVNHDKTVQQHGTQRRHIAEQLLMLLQRRFIWLFGFRPVLRLIADYQMKVFMTYEARHQVEVAATKTSPRELDVISKEQARAENELEFVNNIQSKPAVERSPNRNVQLASTAPPRKAR